MGLARRSLPLVCLLVTICFPCLAKPWSHWLSQWAHYHLQRDPVTGGFARSIDNDGNIDSTAPYSAMGSGRLLYALAAAYRQGNRSPLLIHAIQQERKVLLELLLQEDGYFLPERTVSGQPDPPESFRINEQIYALLGLAATQPIVGSWASYTQLTELVSKFESRFYDPAHGGYFNHSNHQNGKGVEGLLYPLNLLFVLREIAVTSAARMWIEKRIETLLKLTLKKAWNVATGFLREELTDDLRPTLRNFKTENGQPIAVAGHAFQLGYYLCLAIDQKIGTERSRFDFGQSAKSIYQGLLRFGAIDNNGGFFNAFVISPTEAYPYEAWGSSKSMWQQTYALVFLSLGDSLNLFGGTRSPLPTHLNFFANAFWDKTHGGLYGEVNREGTEPVSQLKISPDQRGYHCAVMLAEFSRLHVEPFELE